MPAELYPGNSPLPPFAEQVLQRHTLDLMVSVTQLFLHSNMFAQALREVSLAGLSTFEVSERVSDPSQSPEPICPARDSLRPVV